MEAAVRPQTLLQEVCWLPISTAGLTPGMQNGTERVIALCKAPLSLRAFMCHPLTGCATFPQEKSLATWITWTNCPWIFPIKCDGFSVCRCHWPLLRQRSISPSNSHRHRAPRSQLLLPASSKHWTVMSDEGWEGRAHGQFAIPYTREFE